MVNVITAQKSFTTEYPNPITEEILQSTIRIEALNGKKAMAGTGFYYGVVIDSTKGTIKVGVVTNKHVVKEAVVLNLFFKEADKNDKPISGLPTVIGIPNDAKHVYSHPDPNVDLVFIDISSVFEQFDKKGKKISSFILNKYWIQNDQQIEKWMRPTENILMIGYPNNLWDTKNNFPIAREGITASAAYRNFNGNKEFLIDIAAFPGSSGSPVFYYAENPIDKYKSLGFRPGKELRFLGIVYAGPLYTVKGEIIKSSEQEKGGEVQSAIPMNLAFVIKAEQLLAFDKEILAKIEKSKK